ncbi:MAG: hypothetical protein OXG91_10410 [bacterium]|nr:hypothetical protein [bacterium]MCY3952451.1 hypothetical protein [bacterium]
MRLFVYVVVHDSGFAPNPFFGYCTLATCKPRIRRSAAVGDWIAGIGSAQRGREGRLMYAMRVGEVLCFDEYWHDERFVQKRPSRSGRREQRCGDNVYHRDPRTREWIQEPCFHSCDDGTPDRFHVRCDTGSPRALVATEFAYFGTAAIDIPQRFRSWTGSDYFCSVRDYRCNFPEDLLTEFIAWLRDLTAEPGRRAGDPLDWSKPSPGCAATPRGRPATRRC